MRLSQTSFEKERKANNLQVKKLTRSLGRSHLFSLFVVITYDALEQEF